MAGYILTHHAKERLQQRWITESVIESVLRSPDRTEPGSKPETVKFVRVINDRQVQVVGKYLMAEDKWLVLSVWVRGENDQEPLIWTIITFPFKLIFKLLSRIVQKPQRRF